MTTETDIEVAKLRFEIAKAQANDILREMRHVPNCTTETSNALDVYNKAEELIDLINKKIDRLNE
jgi:hypothetical protein